MTIDLSRCSVVVVAGPQRVGKTTVATSLALGAARRGRRVVALTIDPSDALLDSLGVAPGPEPARATGDDDGELWVTVLDPAAAFDQLVREQSPDDEVAADIVGNPVYRAISGSLDGALELMTIERLLQLHETGDWDLVVVDTPPSPHASDLLRAPSGLVDFLGNPVYRALTVNQRALARLTNAAASVFLGAVRDLAGAEFVDDTLRFFGSLARLEPALRRRAETVGALLRDEATAFVAVTDPQASSVEATDELVASLAEGGFSFGGIVVNRRSPDLRPLADAQRALVARADGALAAQLACYDDLVVRAAAERSVIETLRTTPASAGLIELPMLDGSVAGLDRLADLLTPSEVAPRA